MNVPMSKGRSKAVFLAAFLGFAAPAVAHHSYAMYDQTKTLTLTGVTRQYVAEPNHSHIHFFLIGPDGKLVKGEDGTNVEYGLEMSGAGTMAEQGITAATFPAGTIFSVKLNPMRDGSNFGSRAADTAIAKCPWKTPPAPGKACDSVPGAAILGAKTF